MWCNSCLAATRNAAHSCLSFGQVAQPVDVLVQDSVLLHVKFELASHIGEHAEPSKSTVVGNGGAIESQECLVFAIQGGLALQTMLIHMEHAIKFVLESIQDHLRRIFTVGCLPVHLGEVQVTLHWAMARHLEKEPLHDNGAFLRRLAMEFVV